MPTSTLPNRNSARALLAVFSAVFLCLGPDSAAAAVVVWQDTLPVGVEAVAWSPDGTTIAVGGADTSADDSINLLDAASGAFLGDLPSSPLGTYSLDYSPDGAYLAAGGAIITPPDVPSGINDVFETTGGTSIASYQGSDVAFADAQNRLATAGFGITRGVWVHSVPAGTLLLEAFTDELFASVALSHDGETVAVGTFDGAVRVISVASGQVVTTLDYDDPDSARVTNVAFSPDGTMFAAAGFRFGGVPVATKVWRTSDYSLIHTLSPDELGFSHISFTPDSTVIAAATSAPDLTRRIRFWDAASGQLLQSIEADGFVADLAFSPDGTRLVYGQADGTIVVVCNPLDQSPFDLDGDCDLDLDDYAHFAGCQAGPDQTPAPGCDLVDFDGDGDTDLADFAAFQVGFGHP